VGGGENDDLAGQPYGVPPAPSTLCLLGKEVTPQSFGEPAPHILLVDDDRLSITVMKKILVSRGAVVSTATDGAEAVESFREDGANIDLILMDVHMPNMDGRTAAREILKMQAERELQVPIIGLSACAREDDIRQCLDAGMCAHITKPISAKDLVQIKRVTASCCRKRERGQQEEVAAKSMSSSSFEVTPRSSFDDEVTTPQADHPVQPPQPAPATPRASEPGPLSPPPSPVSLRSTSSTSSGQGALPSPTTPRQVGQAVRRFLDSSLSPVDRPPKKRFTGPPPRILVVEDDAMSQLVMRRLLSTMGAGEVVVADDGVKAVDAVETSGAFDLVLMDLHMPVMDGLTATKLILEGQQTHGLPSTPILALTASVSDREKQRCENSGMAGHIGKPFQLAHIGLLQLAIDESRRRQAQQVPTSPGEC
jgi:CheY-like chemotaxis protein